MNQNAVSNVGRSLGPVKVSTSPQDDNISHPVLHPLVTYSTDFISQMIPSE